MLLTLCQFPCNLDKAKNELSIESSGTSVQEYLNVVISPDGISLIANDEIIIRPLTEANDPMVSLHGIVLLKH